MGVWPACVQMALVEHRGAERNRRRGGGGERGQRGQQATKLEGNSL